MTPLARLRARVEAFGTNLCLGLDPHPSRLPEHLGDGAQAVERFARGVLEAAAPSVVAVKINVAFFEAFGSAGWQALERLRGDVPQSHFLVLDAKRGDIGTTAERYAEALFDRLNADAVTLSPYLGADAIEPFLAHADRVVYVLARTSNPSAGDLQALAVDGVPHHQRVAKWAAHRWPDPRVGLVVGATAPDELRRLRTIVPGPAFLVPGVGAQGGDLAAAAAACDGSLAPGLVSISRGIAEASRGNDWAAAAASAATSWADRFREASATLRA
jgi:orotidine-5'-phosphate decarboxylase